MPVSDAYLMDLQIEDAFYDQIDQDYAEFSDELEPLMQELDALIADILDT